jgi:hypothetical protein
MDKLRFILLTLICLLSLGFSDLVKVYLDFDEFYADWDTYKVLTKYCYMQSDAIDIAGVELLSLYKEVASDTKGEQQSAEYMFKYTKPTGEIFWFIFTNTKWSNHKMFSVGRKSDSYSSLGSYDEAKETWNKLISATDTNKVDVNPLGKIDDETTTWLVVGGLVLVGLAVGM